MALALKFVPIEEGPRNYVLQVTGVSDSVAPVEDVDVFIQPAALNPPCAALRLMRVSYDVADGSVALQNDGATAPFLTMSSGSGQTICYKKVGGIPNREVGNGQVSMTVLGGTTFSMTLHFAKQSPIIPL